MTIAMIMHFISGTRAIKNVTQKAQIKKELMPTVWHPSRWWDCCVPEDKKETEKLWK